MNLTANEKNAAVARQKRYVLLLAVMLVLLFIIIVLSFWVGYYPLTTVQSQKLSVLFHKLSPFFSPHYS